MLSASPPAMRAIVGREGLDRAAASSSQMGHLETEWLATDTNLEALAERGFQREQQSDRRSVPAIPQTRHEAGAERGGHAEGALR